MTIKVDIIVVNWNSGKLTLQAVTPYLNYNNEYININVIVVDNASADNSLALFKGHIEKVIANKENVGFGKACNQAFLQSTADYILLLNPDTISKPEVLEKLVAFLESNVAYGITGPGQVNEKGMILKTCCRFPGFKNSFFEICGLSKVLPKIFTPAPIMTDWDHQQSRDVDHVMGSYMLIRKSIPDAIGFFMDDDYFVFFEDVDLSKRISNAGFKTFYNRQVTIFHEGGGSGHKLKAQRLFYSLSSRNIYWKKHLGKIYYYILTMLSIIIEPPLRLLDSLIKTKKTEIKAISKAYYLYIKKLLHH